MTTRQQTTARPPRSRPFWGQADDAAPLWHETDDGAVVFEAAAEGTTRPEAAETEKDS